MKMWKTEKHQEAEVGSPTPGVNLLFSAGPLSPSCTCSFPASCQGVSLLYFSLALEYSFVGQDASPVRNFRNHVAGSWSLLFSTWENRKTACPRIPNKALSTFRVPFCMQEQQLHQTSCCWHPRVKSSWKSDISSLQICMALVIKQSHGAQG